MSSLPVSITRSRPGLLARFSCYWRLIKDLQTGLLVITAVAAYATGCCTNLQGGSLIELAGSLFLAISGSTVLNMVYDRDIDACMRRTARRPLPSGQIRPAEALILGVMLCVAGVGWALWIYPPYGAAVLAGMIFDVLVYTLWLKRITPYAILIGGLSGGMPALAGRILAMGQVDKVGILLALAVVLWIPTHIMSFHLKYQDDFARAAIPTFPSRYGGAVTRWIIAISTVLAVVAILTVGSWIGLEPGFRYFAWGLSLSLVALVLYILVRPSSKMAFILYKGASIYMLSMMILLIAGGL